MLISKANFLIPKACNHRYLSFLKRVCKKESSNSDNSNEDAGPNVTIQLQNSFKLYNLEAEPASTVSLNQKLARNLYRELQTIRQMERTADSLYRQKIIRGFCHLYVGQEACCVGIKSVMRPTDTIITSYRAHGWTWVMGVSVYEILAELCQKQTGCSRGKGGSMHTYSKNFYGGNGIVGGQVPLGAGVALSHAYRCDGGVNFACYGDGAANQGQLHETFNIACLWKLPIVFVCENNKYGMGTSTERSSCSTDYYTRGDYIPGLWVDGNDVLAVRSASEFALNHASCWGPLVMELETYRYYGHSMSDPGTSYRKREEVTMMRQKNDPITRFKELCLKNKILNEQQFKTIDDAIKAEMNDSVKQILKDKDTYPSELAVDVYANNLERNIRNVVRRDLKHSNVGIRIVPAGVIKATPKSEIKEIPKEKKEEKTPKSKEAMKKDQNVKKASKMEKVQDKKLDKKGPNTSAQKASKIEITDKNKNEQVKKDAKAEKGKDNKPAKKDTNISAKKPSKTDKDKNDKSPKKK